MAGNPDDSVGGDLCALHVFLYQYAGGDLEWIQYGVLVGMEAVQKEKKTDYGLYNQRGYHWPAPAGYENLGKNN